MTLPHAAQVRPRLLIVEDSAFLVLTLEAVCDSLGWGMIGPAGSIAAGLEMARDAQPDAALLDVSLGAEQSWPIAAVLLQRGIPFLFATGHDLAGKLPAQFANVPVLRKPFRLANLEERLQQLLGPLQKVNLHEQA